MSFSIRERQIELLKNMLRLNYSVDSDQYWENLWKVLVYDDHGKDIISPLFTVEDLRKLGVTLYLSLNAPRQAVPGVPVVYFAKPTKENVERICLDCSNKIYSSYFLNFSSTLPRELLELLAQKTVESDCVSQIARVFDQYSSFISLEDSLFISRNQNSFFNFHDPTIRDADALANIDEVVESLFSVVVTLGKIPIIQCPKRGDAAELIAKKLDQKIRDNMANVGNMFADNSGFRTTASFQRPVFVILDRSIDLSVMLSHPWSYQALVHDLLNMGLNRVTVDVKDKDGNVKPTVFDLDPKDPLWSSNAGKSIPQVAVSIRQSVQEYEQKIGKKKKNANSNSSITVVEDEDDGEGIEENDSAVTKSIHETINALPELTKKKEKLDAHSKIAWALLDLIKKHGLDEYVKLEEELTTRSAELIARSAEFVGRSSLQQIKKELLATIESDKGTPEDKLRLFLIFYVTHQNLPASELADFESKLVALGCDLSSLNYLKEIKAFDQNWATQTQNTSSSSSSSSSSFTKEFFSMFGSMVTAGMKYIVPQVKDYYVTRVVDAVMELKTTEKSSSSSGIPDFHYFDPKFPQNSPPPKKNTPFKEAVVFMVGGGNYLEYQNLRDYAEKVPSNVPEGVNPATLTKKIIYGTTEMLNGQQFLAQLGKLGTVYKNKNIKPQ